MKRSSMRLLLLLLVFRSLDLTAAAVDFRDDIRPIFNKHCVACHGGVKQAADLSFVYRDQALTVIELGDPAASTLIERVTSRDDDVRMPPPDHGAPLGDKEIQLLRQWIEEGAAWQDHWAFKAPKSTILPPTQRHDWARGPIDSFVLARLEGEGIEPAAAAEPLRWLRRVSLDLIGLPPTIGESEDFLQSIERLGEGAWAQQVDRLLDAPQFGERWASVWLDAVRYADSKGLGQDGRRSIWKYRDWVIDALNRDMPFDEFTVAQIAGDLLPNPGLEDLVATACHRLTQTNEEGGTDDEQFRLEAVLDRVNTTWQVWQGMTFGCAQCHSHPYDPIRHDEYYQFLAFFNNTADSDLNNDEPRIQVPLRSQDYAKARELDQAVEGLHAKIFESGYALLMDERRWSGVTELEATTSAATQLAVATADGVAEFYTEGTVAKHTTLTLEVTIPRSLQSITAIRLTGLPHDPKKALADSEWGFVLSHVDVSAVEEGVARPLEVARVIGDNLHPFHDPQLSLDAKQPRGYGAYSRIRHPRRAAFVLAEPLHVAPGTRLQLKLSHRLVETGAFPLVTRRGRIALSNDDRFSHWLHDPSVLENRQRLAALRKQRAEINSIPTPIMQERFAPLARSTHVFERGNFLVKGAQVRPKTPDFLPPPSLPGRTRLHLARWLVQPENPLTARVAVNRLWAQMFGIGIVETQEDFGSSGARPSHPELLDDLAVRFSNAMQWSVKALLKEISLSATYRQSSKASHAKRVRDPQNRLLSRGPRSRLPAEVVRDQALAISGLLSPTMYGPPAYPPLPANVWKPFQGGDAWKTPAEQDPDRYRRSLYTYTKRSIPFPMFAAFDAPSREFCTVRRLPSNTPLQALMTLNDVAFVEASRALARRMLRAGETPHEQLEFGIRLATSRRPYQHELARLTELYTITLHDVADHPNAELVALSNVATVLLNLDEVLCK